MSDVSRTYCTCSMSCASDSATLRPSDRRSNATGGGADRSVASERGGAGNDEMGSKTVAAAAAADGPAVAVGACGGEAAGVAGCCCAAALCRSGISCAGAGGCHAATPCRGGVSCAGWLVNCVSRWASLLALGRPPSRPSPVPSGPAAEGGVPGNAAGEPELCCRDDTSGVAGGHSAAAACAAPIILSLRLFVAGDLLSGAS